MRISPALLSLIKEYEQSHDEGRSIQLSDKEYIDIINYYEVECDLDRALDIINDAIDKFSYSVEFLKLKTRLLLKRGRLNEAFSVIEQGELVAPFDTDLLLLKAQVFIYQKNWSSSWQIISDLLQVVNKSELIDVYLTEAFYHENLHEFHSMYAVLKKVLTMSPSNDEALEMMYTAVEVSRNYEESIELHQQIVDNHPYTSRAWFNLGHSFANIGEYEKAIDALEYAFIINPRFEDAYLDCAEYCREKKQFLRALDIYIEAEDILGEDFDLLLNKAQCQYQLSKIDDAKRTLFTAIEIDPYNDEALYLLSQCHMVNENWNGAIKVLKKTIAIENQIEEYFHALASCYEQINNVDRAKHYYKKAALKSFEIAKYWEDYIVFLLKNGFDHEVFETIQKADKYTFSYELKYLEALALIKHDRQDEGYALLENLLEESTEEHHIINRLPEILISHPRIMAILSYYYQSN